MKNSIFKARNFFGMGLLLAFMSIAFIGPSSHTLKTKIQKPKNNLVSSSVVTRTNGLNLNPEGGYNTIVNKTLVTSTTPSVTYVSSGGLVKTVNPYSVDITDTGEGWTWYKNATTAGIDSSGTNTASYSAQTLVLHGINFDIDDPIEYRNYYNGDGSGNPYYLNAVAIYGLHSASSFDCYTDFHIVLLDNTVNTLKMEDVTPTTQNEGSVYEYDQYDGILSVGAEIYGNGTLILNNSIAIGQGATGYHAFAFGSHNTTPNITITDGGIYHTNGYLHFLGGNINVVSSKNAIWIWGGTIFIKNDNTNLYLKTTSTTYTALTFDSATIIINGGTARFETGGSAVMNATPALGDGVALLEGGPTETRAVYGSGSATNYNFEIENSGDGTYGSGYYLLNATAQIYAGSKNGQTFKNWSTTSASISIADVNDPYTTVTVGGAGTITANWTNNIYKVNYWLNGGEFEADYANIYTYGTGVTLTIPTYGTYTFGGWFDNATLTGSAVTSVTSDDYGDKTFYAKWDVAASSTYTITATAEANGSISPSGSIIYDGVSQVFTITPNQGYKIDTFTIDDVDKKSEIVSDTYTITGASNSAIKVTFAEITSSDKIITATAGENGTISPSGFVSVESGNSQVFTFSGNVEYIVEDVLVDGSSIGAVNSYTFTNVTANHTISVSFKISHTYGTWIDEIPATCETAGTLGHYHCSICGKDLDASFNELTSLVIPALGHDYVTTYVWNDAGNQCTATRVCSHDASHTDTETVTGTPVVTQNKSCELDELSTYVASFTKTFFVTQTNAGVKTANKLGHTYGNLIDAVAATCEDAGTVAHYHCDVCGKNFDANHNEIADISTAALGHAYGTPTYEWNGDQCTAKRVCTTDTTHIESETVTAIKIVTQNKTCELEEKSTYVASFENISFATQRENNVTTAAALGHTYGSWISAVGATCENAGSVAHYHCSVCGKNFDADYHEITDITIAAIGHDYEAATYVWSGDQCTATKICANDSTHVVTETVTATKVITQVRSCENDEISTYIANFTKDGFTTQKKEGVITATHNAHDYGEWIPEVPATTTSSGVKGHYHCSICGKDFDAEYHEITDLKIEALAHNYEAPTYAWDGIKCTATRVCTDDADYTQTETVTALKVVTQKATCEQEEKSTYVASFENAAFATQSKDNVVTGAKEEHSYGTWIEEVPATCEEAGVKGHYHCDVCGKNFDADHNEITDLTIAKLEHDYGEWIEEVEATTTSTGVKGHYHCSICGKDFDADHNEITDLVIPMLTVTEEKTDNTVAVAATSSLASILFVELIFALSKFLKMRKVSKMTKTYSFAPIFIIVALSTGYIAAITVLAVLVVLVLLANLYLFVPRVKNKTDKFIQKHKEKAASKKAQKEASKVKEAAPVSETKAPINEEVKPVTQEVSSPISPITKELPTGFNIQYVRSFQAKLIQSSDETKAYYKSIKMAILSYKKISDRVSWSYETLNRGRVKAFKFSIRGKTLCLSLALDPKDYDNTKYHVEEDDHSKFMETPCLYRIKNDRRAKYAIDLIDALALKLGLEKSKKPVEELAPIPSESTESLLAKGLIKKIEMAKKEEPQVESEVEPKNEPLLIQEEQSEFGSSIKAHYKRSFLAKLIQASDESKSYYRSIKLEAMSFKKISDRVSWGYETFNHGRVKFLKYCIKGKTLCLCLALNPDDYKDSKYKVEKAEGSKYEETPCLYRIKNDRRAKYAVELIEVLATKLGLEKAKKAPTPTGDIPYESTESLLKQGLIRELVVKEPLPKEEMKSVNEPIKEPIKEETSELEDDSEEESTSPFAIKAHYKRSFNSRLIQASDESKAYYASIRDEALSYRKVSDRISWSYETVNLGRNKLLKFGFKGKTLCLYLALNPDDYANTKYHVEKIEGKKYEDTACLYRIKNDRRAKYALELISKVVEKYSLTKRRSPLPPTIPPVYESTDSLVSKGLIKDLLAK